MFDVLLYRSFNARGKYEVRLYNKATKKFEVVVIDDFIPCDASSNRPIYQKLVSNEMWPLLLEKAFAKFRGGYSAIDGGDPLDALQALTGYEGEHIFATGSIFDDKVFKKVELFFPLPKLDLRY